jgi:hypothetical protein
MTNDRLVRRIAGIQVQLYSLKCDITSLAGAKQLSEDELEILRNAILDLSNVEEKIQDLELPVE